MRILLLASLVLLPLVVNAASPPPALIDCTAKCQDGSTVTCVGTSFCRAVDVNCFTGQVGYCSSDRETKYCPGPSCT